jgi:exonuclease 3'-5' domain-containing protein 1
VASSLIDSITSLGFFIDNVAKLPAHPPSLYVDLEGEKLSRNGHISLITVLVTSESHVYLIDVHSLQETAFTSAGKAGMTLRTILEFGSIPKVFFDVHNDSDALFAHFGIALQGIQDVQLMENASRSGHISGKRYPWLRTIKDDDDGASHYLP